MNETKTFVVSQTITKAKNNLRYVVVDKEKQFSLSMATQVIFFDLLDNVLKVTLEVGVWTYHVNGIIHYIFIDYLRQPSHCVKVLSYFNLIWLGTSSFMNIRLMDYER